MLPWSYAASVAPPPVTSMVSAADGVSPVAPGGLISVFGNQFSATNLATSQIPLPTALANSCLTVNGQPMPLIFVSPNQINAQMPAQAVGDVDGQWSHTPGGVSDNFNLTVQPTAPAVFLSGIGWSGNQYSDRDPHGEQSAGDGFESDPPQRHADHLPHRLRQHVAGSPRRQPAPWKSAGDDRRGADSSIGRCRI